jgi:membrane protease YdiL (CAAX protease family)
MSRKVAPAETPEGPWRRAIREYWRQTRRPLVSLAFVLPLLIAYEGGVLFLGGQAVRNGADVWLRQFLDQLGFGQYFLLPALTVGVLLGWHHTTHERWRISGPVLYTMFAECAVLAWALVFLGRTQSVLLQALLGTSATVEATRATVWTLSSGPAAWAVVLGFVGAGVYEELLFRLLLLPPVCMGAARLGVMRGLRVGGAIVLTSLAFAAAHYLGPQGEHLELFGFLFRFTAGAVFASLFVFRGFGIAAGTHALYDIFVGVG